jgi:class 3 adenylate cyclase/tetratricopeptide (TPR) repeat protein/ketosteroid isomerase-like protein
VPRCAACGETADADALFCEACGASLAERPTDKPIARKVVTIVFADLIGSVSLHERLDAESTRRVMERYHRAMTAAVEIHGGTVVQLLGDGVLAAFGVPRVAEDDAIRAVWAALGMQRAFRELAREQGAALAGVGLRVAVNTGEIVVGADETSVIGDPTNVAARLQQEARDGDILVGEGTKRLVADLVTLAPLGSFALRGRAEAVPAYRLVSLDRPTRAHTTEFVGRHEELSRLLTLYDAAVTAHAAKLAVLLGSPGVGKSRLVAEFACRVGERATVLAAPCDAATGATFAPLAEALRACLRVDDGTAGDGLRAAIDAVVPGDDGERARVAAGIAALLAGTPPVPEETFFVVRRLLAALASVRPVVLVFDDLHWAEPLLLDLVEHLVQWSTGVPLLVVGAARPELHEVRSTLARPGGLVADVVVLSGLEAGPATRLAASVIGASELPAALVGRVLATSEGNPLFVAELVRMLVQDGTLRREDDRWITTAELAKLEMPPTIQVLLAARIERLRPEERSVLERAAVIGRVFSRAAVAHLLSRDASQLDAQLAALRRSELIEPDAGWFLGEPALRFHHMLIRDAAYRRVLKETRADLHERFADWIAKRAGDLVEQDETIGWHIEQAYRNLRELGALDAHGRSLGERAARHLGAAGRRALARDDLSRAAGLLGRAIETLDPRDPGRPELVLDWCEALLAAGEVGTAARALEELGCLAADSERLRAWHTCFAGQLASLADPQSLRATVGAVASAAAALAEAGDPAGEAKAHTVHAGTLARLGEIGACEAALDRALAAARRAHDRRRANVVLAGAPVAALWGPSPVARASGRCLDVVRVLRITQGAPAVEAVALRCQGVLEALRGRADAARRMIASARRTVEELGIGAQLLEVDAFAGLIELLEGDPGAAEPLLRAAYEGLRARGLGIDAARAAALLGRALLAQDRAAEAEALSHASEALAGDDLKAAIAWRGVRGEALARRGEADAAVELARAAVATAEATDALLDHADARLALAAVLRAAGRAAEADAERRRAVELWEAKGATRLVERACRERPPAEAPDGGAARLDRRRIEWVDMDHAVEALVRFDELARPQAASPRLARRVAPNAAAALASRVEAAIAARDTAAIEDLLGGVTALVDHATGAAFGPDAILTTRDVLLRAQRPVLEHELIATLGSSLALLRGTMVFEALEEGESPPVGPVRRGALVLLQVGSDGRLRRAELFAADDSGLGAAVARLYERHAELAPEGSERARAAMTAGAVAAVLPTDIEAIAGVLAPDVDFVDHRLLGLGTTRGAERYLRGLRSLLEVTGDRIASVDELLMATPEALVVHRTTRGTDLRGGGAFEMDFVMLWSFGPDGRITRVEMFDPGREGDALARIDPLAEVPSLPRFQNAAWRAQIEFERSWRERSWEEIRSSYGAAPRLFDRRSLVGIDLEGESFYESLHLLFALPASRWTSELLATRGERLALMRASFSAEPHGGARVESEHLLLLESGDTPPVAITIFDSEALDAAHAELDRRFAAGEGAPYAELLERIEAFRRAGASGDRESLDAILPRDFQIVSHRHLSSPGVPIARDLYLRFLSQPNAVGEFDLHAHLRLDHLRLSSSAAIGESTWYGTLAGGAFEVPVVFVFPHDGRRFRSWELFDPDQLDAARARFEQLSRGPGAARIENAATRADRLLERAWAARDWEGYCASYAPHFRSIDRRALMQLEVDRDTMLAGLWPFFDAGVARSSEALATRGEHLALIRTRLSGSTGQSGLSEVELLQVIETDAEGRRIAAVAFETEAEDAARAELDARHAAGEAAPFERVVAAMGAFAEALAKRDWGALAAQCARDLVVQDHRRLGWETLCGPEAYGAALRGLVDLAPDTRMRLDHVEVVRDGYLVLTTWQGTREGGPFEEPSLMVGALDAAGRVRRFDQYDLDRLDEARARFAELGRGR